MSCDANHLPWIDMEMTGLDPKTCVVLEIATLVTDKDLNLIAEGPVLAVHQPESALASMDEWNKKHHGDSGLLSRVRQSSLSLEDAEQKTIDFLQQHCPAGKNPLCGNSVHQDRRFLRAYMPRLDSFFHYRLIDVSTVKELAKRWYPDVAEFKKKQNHLAIDDIRESVEELKYLREHLFK